LAEGTEKAMYSPLVKASNSPLDELSEIKVPGLPDYNEGYQIVFVRTDARCVVPESPIQGQFKPDIVPLQWKTFKVIAGGPSLLFSATYTSDICCRSGTHQPKFNWRNLLSTLEVKRGVNEMAGERLRTKQYTSGFQDLSAGRPAAEPPTSLPPTQPDMVQEEYPAHNRMSISPSTLARLLTHLSPDTHQQIAESMITNYNPLTPKLGVITHYNAL
jgi:hypothetical protein